MSPSVKATTYLRPEGRNNKELRSMIFGLSENLAREMSAFNLGSVSSRPFYYSFYYLWYPFSLFIIARSFSFLFCFLSFFFWPHSSSVLFFFMKYLDPLNYLVSVALTKKILRFSFPRNIKSWADNSSFVIYSFLLPLCPFFCTFLLDEGYSILGWSWGSAYVNMSAGTSKSC